MSHGGEIELWRELTGERRAYLPALPAPILNDLIAAPPREAGLAAR
jgi:hypothetical protein